MIVADGESGESSEDSDLLDSLCVTRRVSDGETDSKLSAKLSGHLYLSGTVAYTKLKNIIVVNANKRKHNLVSHPSGHMNVY